MLELGCPQCACDIVRRRIDQIAVVDPRRVVGDDRVGVCTRNDEQVDDVSERRRVPAPRESTNAAGAISID